MSHNCICVSVGQLHVTVMRQLCLIIVFFSIFWKEANCDYPYHVPIKCANVIDSCSESYSTLVMELLQNERNYLSLQKTFFPPSSASPVFLEVFYQYGNDTDCEGDDYNDFPCTYFWSSVYFFFVPVRVFQYTSLLFSNPSLRYGNVTLYLPEECRYVPSCLPSPWRACFVIPIFLVNLS